MSFSVNILMKRLVADSPINLYVKYMKLPQYRQKVTFSLCSGQQCSCVLGLRSSSAHPLSFPLFTVRPSLLRHTGLERQACSYTPVTNCLQHTDDERRPHRLWFRLKLRTRNLQKLKSCFLNTLYGKNTAKILFLFKEEKIYCYGYGSKDD